MAERLTDAKMELRHKDITEAIIGAAFEVYRVLGYGFLESVYKHAMQVELRARGYEAKLRKKSTSSLKGSKWVTSKPTCGSRNA
jgi:GxxExxY protein